MGRSGIRIQGVWPAYNRNELMLQKINFDVDDLVKFKDIVLDAEKPLYEGCVDKKMHCWQQMVEKIIKPKKTSKSKIESISEDLRWHATRRITDGVLRHPADSQAWRTIDEKFPEIAEDTRNLRLGISADGVDVNTRNKHHSVWPVLTVIYNLPPWLCMKRKFINLSVLISGYPGNDIDVFLEPLVDDLHTLFETGVDTYDASTKDNFNLCAVVLWTINDYPALGTLCGCPYSGFKGCVVCGKDTNCVRLSALSKQKNQEDTRGRGGKIQKQKRNTTEEEGSSSQVNRQNGVYWKKFNIWYRKLKYWRHNPIPHCIDFMHVEKNVAESIVGTLLHVPGKTKDGLNARLDLAELGVKPELFAMQDEDKTTLPLAGYTLTNAKKDIFCETLHNIKGIKGYCSIIKFGTKEVEFFSEYHRSMETIGIPPDKHETYENEEGKPLSAKKTSEVSAELFQKAHLYVIQNTDEIVPYIEIENILVNLDSSLDNNNSYSYNTYPISTSEEIDYDSPEPPKSLLKWYHYLSDEYKDNGRFWGSKSGSSSKAKSEDTMTLLREDREEEA
ncbi:putative transposon, En/Spm-like protein [Tanacetum coccineum]